MPGKPPRSTIVRINNIIYIYIQYINILYTESERNAFYCATVTTPGAIDSQPSYFHFIRRESQLRRSDGHCIDRDGMV